MIKDKTDEGFEKAYQIFLEEAEECGATIVPSEDGKGHLYINGEEADIEKVFEKFFGKDNDKDLFDDLSESEKLQTDVMAKIEMLLHEAEECPEWRAKQALRCLRLELRESWGW